MTSVEAFLTRELEIRFIDARELANEAKVSLGMEGYPSKDQKRKIKIKAIHLFRCRPEEEQMNMRRLSETLDSIKAETMSYGGDSSSFMLDGNESDDMDSFDRNSTTSSGKRKLSWFKMGRR